MTYRGDTNLLKESLEVEFQKHWRYSISLHQTILYSRYYKIICIQSAAVDSNDRGTLPVVFRETRDC